MAQIQFIQINGNKYNLVEINFYLLVNTKIQIFMNPLKDVSKIPVIEFI